MRLHWRCTLCGERLFPPARRPSAHRICLRHQPIIEAWERAAEAAARAAKGSS